MTLRYWSLCLPAPRDSDQAIAPYLGAGPTPGWGSMSLHRWAALGHPSTPHPPQCQNRSIHFCHSCQSNTEHNGWADPIPVPIVSKASICVLGGAKVRPTGLDEGFWGKMSTSWDGSDTKNEPARVSAQARGARVRVELGTGSARSAPPYVNRGACAPWSPQCLCQSCCKE